jgi:hypothetical protein
VTGRRSGTWSTTQDIAAKLRRRWDDGSLLRSHALGEQFDAIEVPLRGPKPSEIGDDLAAVRQWIADLAAGSRDGRRYDLDWQAIGGRTIGRNEIRVRAVVSTHEQAWALLGAADAVRRFDDIRAITERNPAVRDWAIAHPLRALDLHSDMSRLVSAYEWLDAHRGSGRYLREISAPGVDTKFAERHRGALAAMLGVPSTASGFLTGLGLRAKPELVRLRPAPSLGLPAPVTELALRATELAQLQVKPRIALVIENEITYLSTDVPADGIVIWGKGFEVDRVGRLPWLVDVEVVYWGDIDTHGFAILDRLRAWLPKTRSILMDRQTLLAHRDRWTTEDRPATSRLTRLRQTELDLFAELVSDVHGDKVRLEQERVDWQWASQHLATSTDSSRYHLRSTLGPSHSVPSGYSETGSEGASLTTPSESVASDPGQ